MISSVPPMIALTATVATLTWATYHRNTAYDAGVLADNLARHHGQVLAPLFEQAALGFPLADGPRPDPQMRPFQPMHDWQSAVFRQDGVVWLVTYPIDFPDTPGRFGLEGMRRIPSWLEREGTAADAIGLWNPDVDGGSVDGLAFDDPSVPQIGAAAPVIMTRID